MKVMSDKSNTKFSNISEKRLHIVRYIYAQQQKYWKSPIVFKR